MHWATFWTLFAQTHLVTLLSSKLAHCRHKDDMRHPDEYFVRGSHKTVDIQTYVHKTLACKLLLSRGTVLDSD
jgi:hypothetical protein